MSGNECKFGRVADSNQERDNIQAELEASNEKVDEMEATVAGIKSEQLKYLSIENDATLEHTKELETHLGSATDERDGFRFKLEVSHAKTVELVAAIDSLKESARETSLQMKALFGEKEAALAVVIVLQSKLTDTCQGHDVAQYLFEASNTKVEEQEELQSYTKTHVVQLVDNTQALESARSELEAGSTSTIAEHIGDHAADAAVLNEP